MKNKIFSLLTVICLAACLLPAIARAATVSASVTLAGNTLKVSGYDTPAYSVNADVELSGITFTTQTLGGDAKNWNAKLIWNSGEDMPTVYLQGFIVDEYDEETAKWQKSSTTAIAIPPDQPTRIVITGEDSRIKTPFGITYQSDLEIISEGDAKLHIWNRSTAITSDTATGCPLTINANLDLFVEAYYDASSHILQTNNADLTINGGNIKIATNDKKSLFGIVTRNSGNIIISSGELDVTSSIGAAPSNGSIHSSGKLIITDGTVKATAKSSVPLYAKKGIEINGGQVDIISPYYGINAGSAEDPADIAINGGTVTIAAQRAFFTYPLLGEGVFAYAGADEESAEVYDGTLTALAKEPWMLISNDSSQQIETEATQAPTTTPTELSTAAPTAAPTTAPTEAPTTAPTQAPTATPTEAPTEASDQDTEVLRSPYLLIVLVAAAAMGLVGIVITLIVFKRKKP